MKPAIQPTHLLITLVLALPVTTTAQQARVFTLGGATVTIEGEFVFISAVRELSDGSLLFTDRREGSLLHYDAGTGAITVIGRKGDGPGEYRSAGALFPVGVDSTLFLDHFTGRWLRLHESKIIGTYAESSPAASILRNGIVHGADRRGGVLASFDAIYSGTGPHFRGTADSLAMVYLRITESVPDTLGRLRGPGRSGFANLPPSGNQPRRLFVVSPLATMEAALLMEDGWIAVARIEPYRVDWRAPDGRWTRGAPLDFARLPVTEREKCFALALETRGLAPCDHAARPGWPTEMPPFRFGQGMRPPTLLASPQGHLVIARMPTAADPRRRYDFVDREGRLVGRLFTAPNETLVGFGARSVYVVVTDADDVPTIRRHPWT